MTGFTFWRFTALGSFAYGSTTCTLVYAHWAHWYASDDTASQLHRTAGDPGGRTPYPPFSVEGPNVAGSDSREGMSRE